MKRSIQVLFDSQFESEHKNDKGVYSIYFINSDKFYIGSTNGIKGFVGRWRQHLQMLRNNKHTNLILQRTYNKYGEECLKLKIVELCKEDKEYILSREQFYLDSLKPTLNVNQVAFGCVFPENWISPLAKPVLQYDLDGNFIKEFSSIAEAHRAISADIYQALDNLDKYPTQAGGFQWRLKESEDVELKIPPYKYSQELTILCYNSDGDFYKEFPSILKASQELNIDCGNISKVINNLMNSIDGYFFKKKESDNYPLHIDDKLRLHKFQKFINIEDLCTGEKYHFDSLRGIPKELINRCSLQPYIKQGINEFIFKKRGSTKKYKIKIQNYNKI